MLAVFGSMCLISLCIIPATGAIVCARLYIRIWSIRASQDEVFVRLHLYVTNDDSVMLGIELWAHTQGLHAITEAE